MSLQAGRLRHRIQIQERYEILDSDGDVFQDPETGAVPYIWTTISECWAAVEPVSGKEFIQSQATQSKVVGRVVIRWNPGINAGMRILHQRIVAGAPIPSIVYNIEAIMTDKESGIEYMTLLCSQGINSDGA